VFSKTKKKALSLRENRKENIDHERKTPKNKLFSRLPGKNQQIRNKKMHCRSEWATKNLKRPWPAGARASRPPICGRDILALCGLYQSLPKKIVEFLKYDPQKSTIPTPS
jgi:hypothetical protein